MIMIVPKCVVVKTRRQVCSIYFARKLVKISQPLMKDELAKFAINEILPLAAEKDAKATLDIAWEAYKSGRFRAK